MAARNTVSRVSFAGGELSNTAAARDDFGRYQNSIERGENVVVMQEGGLTRVPGTRLVLALKNETQTARHLPFRLSSTDYYTLIINAGVARIVRAGGFVQNPDTSPHEFVTPWTEAQLASLRSAREDNNLYVVSQIKPKVITRTALLTWAVADYAPENGPVGDQNLNESITVQSSGETGSVTLTGAGNPFTADMVGNVMRLDDRDLSIIPQWVPNEAAIPDSSLRRFNGRVYKADDGPNNGGVNPPEHEEGAIRAGTGLIIWVYYEDDHGYVRIDTFTNANSVTATVLKKLPLSVTTGPTYRWYPPAWTDTLGWPSAISFVSDRLAFYRGARGWVTSLNSATDHDTGTGEDDEAFNFKLKAPDDSEVSILGAIPSGAQLLFCSDQEVVLRGVNVFDQLTPRNSKAIFETTNGSAAIQQILVDGGAIYVGRTQKRLHFAKYLREEQRISDEEMSAFARHLFRKKVAGMCWQRDPHRILWLWFVDGSVGAMTYVPKQEILAFTRRTFTNGFVEEMSCVPSTTSGTDEVTLTVRRTIAGQTRRFIEQFVDFFEPQDLASPTAAGAWFVDCGLRATGVQMTTITGLGHLRGQEVAVFADGAEQTRKVVSDAGTILLDRAANDVVVGLPTEIYIRDLPRNFNVPGGSSKGKAKNAHKAQVQFDETFGGEIRVYDPKRGVAGAPDNGIWEQIIKTGAIDYGAPPPLTTGIKDVPVSGNSREEAQLEFRAKHSGPVTILAMSPTIDVEES